MKDTWLYFHKILTLSNPRSYQFDTCKFGTIDSDFCA